MTLFSITHTFQTLTNVLIGHHVAEKLYAKMHLEPLNVPAQMDYPLIQQLEPVQVPWFVATTTTALEMQYV